MSDFKFVVCIPARYASTRLPGKPLIKLKGKELILWAVEAASQLGAMEVVVATDDKRISDLVENHGYQAVMTSSEHQTGTDRLAECAAIMGWSDETWVLNYQGDEPNIPVSNVREVIDLVKSKPEASIGTLYQKIQSSEDLFNPSVVKLVTDKYQRALYFSRAPIPWSQKNFQWSADQNTEKGTMLSNDVEFKHHIGLYMYKTSFLHRFAEMPPVSLEQVESLEQLRALANGETIVAAAAVEPMPHGIDTAADVERFENG